MSQYPSNQVNGNGNSNGKGASSIGQPDPEVVVRAKRRQFSTADKVRILQEADACSKPGQIGGLLEGITQLLISQIVGIAL